MKTYPVVLGLGASLGALGLFASSCEVVSGAGADANVDVPSVPDAATVDADATSPVDAGPDEDAPGCPFVACPDADFYVTVVGDGPLQIFRNHSPEGPPIAQLELPNTFIVSGSAQPDAQGPGVELGFQSPSYASVCYRRSDGYELCSYELDGAPANVTLTQVDPPGGIVAGSYYGEVGDSQDASSVVTIAGSFVVCRVCDWAPKP